MLKNKRPQSINPN